MDPDTADKISEAWAQASLPDDGSFLLRPAMDRFAGHIVRLISPEPHVDGWAIVTADGFGESPEGYEWTRAAAILVGDVVYVVRGAMSVQRKSFATATRRFESMAVRRVLHTVNDVGGQSAEWTFAAADDDATLVVDEWLDHQGCPTSSTDRAGAFARKLADSTGWAVGADS